MTSTAGPFRVLLVGSFRSVIPEGWDTPLGGQGGFVDTLAPSPYSLANAVLQVFAEADERVRRTCRIERLDLAEPFYIEDEREHVELSREDLDRILAHEPDLVAFSTYCWNLDTVKRAANELKRRRPHLEVILGGRGTEGDPVSLLANAPAIDGAVLGEGEAAFVEVLLHRGERLAGIPGVVCRDGDRIVSGPPPRCIDDLDLIPSPYLAGALEPPADGMMLETSRGCLHRCGYCTWNAEKRLRFFGADRIAAEAAWALDHGHRHITLDDSAINYDTNRLRSLVGAFRSADPEGRIRLTYNLRHDLLDEEQIDLLSRLPTHMVLLGVETLSSPAMGQVDRAEVDVDRLGETLAALSRATRPPVVSVVLGLPGDDEESFFHTTLAPLLEWTRAPGDGPPVVGTVLVSLLQVYPGSTLWSRRDELGLRFNEPGIPYLIESPDWPRDALARAKRRLVDLMAEHPDTLKAAEAIVLMDALREVDPWLSRRRVAGLLRSWPRGVTREGWTLERMGLMRDTGAGFSLRFAWHAGGEARVVLRRRRSSRRGSAETRLYSLSLRRLPGCTAPAGPCSWLEREVRRVLLEGEERAARSAESSTR